MPPTRRELLRLASDTGFEAASLEKVTRLGELLDAISHRPRLASALVLKGGTALNLFFGAPTRLSVDLDFNFVGAVEKKHMEQARPGLEAELERVARAAGYATQRSGDSFAGRKLYLSYRRITDGLRDRVEVDINYLYRRSLLDTEYRRMWRPGQPAGDELAVLSFDELAAGKLTAFLDRAAPRDAWDVARLPVIAEGGWPTSRSKAIFIAMAGVLPHALHTYADRELTGLDDAEVVRLLHPLLVSGERPTAEGLRKAASDVVAPLLELTDIEREFCDRLQRGSLRPELLFPDHPELAGRVATSPPLLWKVRNALQHSDQEA